jgi:hypothetical protein
MRKHNKAIPILATILLTALFFFVLSPVFKSQAGTLGNTYLYLSRIQSNLAGTTGQEVEIILAFTPSQSFYLADAARVDIFFPMADNAQWCRTAGSLTVAGVTSAPPDVTGGHDITAALPGTLTATCSQGNGTTTVDTISITGVGDLVNTSTYGVKVSNGTLAGVLGTSATSGSRTVTVQVSDNNNLDSKSFGVYLIADDTVEVTATVAAAPTVTCALSPVTVSLGTLYPGGGLIEVLSTNQITTSSTNSGYYWAAYGKGNGTNAGLYSGAYLIQSGTGTGTVNISAGGSEGFGITLTQPTGATVPTDFLTGTPGVYGSLGANSTGARLILYKASETSPAQSASVYYGARAGSSAPSGTYTEYLTYVCGGYY